MTGTDGISSLQKMLGQLQGSDTRTGKLDNAGATASMTGPDGVSAPTSDKLDQASLSTAGGLAAAAAGDSDVRMDKVAQLQQAIASGNYQISSTDVASKLVDSLLSGR